LGVRLVILLETMMDAYLKKKWVEALRSGKYKQGQQRLRTTDDCYCCLGVLCDVAGGGEWKRGPDGWDYHLDNTVGYALLPPAMEVRVFGTLNPTPVTGPLIALNDSQRASFAEIADYIEANL
jgi:hypothetical protein